MRRWFLAIVLWVALVAGLHLAAQAALCTLTWTASPATNIAGYAMFTSLVSGEYKQGPAWIGNATTAICEDLGLTADGLVHYFVVKVFDTTGQYSIPTNEVAKLLENDTTPPPPPPAPIVCKKWNPKGKCTQWGTE